MPVAAFRSLLAELLGVPSVAAAPAQTKAYAPKIRKQRRTR
jgi:hypothetical protein